MKKRNVGTIDRIIRLALGSMLVMSGLRGLRTPRSWTPWSLLIIGTSFLAEGITRWCPFLGSLGLTSEAFKNETVESESVTRRIEVTRGTGRETPRLMVSKVKSKVEAQRDPERRRSP